MIHQPSALRQLVFGEPTQELADAFKLLCLITLVQRMETLFQANRFQSIFGVACGNTEGLRAVRYAYERALLVPEITTYVTKAVAVLVSASPAGKTLHLTKSNSKTHGQGSFCTEKMMGDMIHIEIQSYREKMQQEMKKEMEGMIHMEMQTYREKMQQEMQKEQEKDRGFRSSLHFLVLPFFQVRDYWTEHFYVVHFILCFRSNNIGSIRLTRGHTTSCACILMLPILPSLLTVYAV